MPVRMSSSSAARADSARTKSSAVVSFTLPASPSNVVTGRPAHSASAASSEKSCRPSCAARAMRVEQRREREGLRRLRSARNVVAVDAFAITRSCRVDCLHRVGDRQRRDRGAARLSPPRSRDRPALRVAKGRAASWTSTKSGGDRSSAVEAGQHRGLAGRAADDRRRQVEARCMRARIEALVVRMDHGLDRSQSADGSRNSRRLGADHRLAGQSSVLLGQFRHRRGFRGRPPATIAAISLP